MLELLLEIGDAVSVAEIMRHLHIPRTTAFEIVHVLKARGYLEADANGGAYRLGRKLYKLALGYESTSSLYRAGRDAVGAVRDQTGKTCYLSVLEDDRALVLLGAEGRESVVVSPPVGQTAPANWSADGILLLTALAPEVLRQRAAFLVQPSPTARAPIDVDTLVSLASKARRRRFLITDGFHHDQMSIAASPVLDADGNCVAALAIAAYTPTLDTASRKKIASALTDAGGRLGAALLA